MKKIIPSVPFEDAPANGEFRWRSEIEGFEVSTVSTTGLKPMRNITVGFTGHREAKYETCLFKINEQGERIEMWSHVVAEYDSREDSAKGHDKIVKAIEKGRFVGKDTFTGDEVTIITNEISSK